MDKIVDYATGNNKATQKSEGSKSCPELAEGLNEVQASSSSIQEKTQQQVPSYQLDRLMKSAAPSPAPSQVAEAFNLPCRVSEQTIFNQQINPVSDFPQPNVFQQQNSFVRQPQPMTFQPYQRFNTQSNIHDFPQRSTRPWFPPNVNQAQPFFGMSQQASGVFPIGPPIPSLSNRNQPDTNQLPPKLPVAGDSSEQNIQQLPSCQFEKTQDVSQSGPCLNPFIHFDPLNPLHIAGTDTTKSASSQLHQHSAEMGDKNGTDTGDKVDNGGTKDGSEKAGHVDM